MNKKILLTVASFAFATQVYAGGDITSIMEPDVEVPEIHESSHGESKFYIVAKGLRVLGEKYDNDGVTEDGSSDYGFGIDFGYKLSEHFALEYDFSYSKNTVVEIDEHKDEEEVTGTYYTSAIDIVYTHHLTHHFGLFVKAGIEIEQETIGHSDVTSLGIVGGVGAEYALNEHYSLLAEYERSSIRGPRGDGIFVGVMYSF